MSFLIPNSFKKYSNTRTWTTDPGWLILHSLYFCCLRLFKNHKWHIKDILHTPETVHEYSYPNFKMYTPMVITLSLFREFSEHCEAHKNSFLISLLFLLNCLPVLMSHWVPRYWMRVAWKAVGTLRQLFKVPFNLAIFSFGPQKGCQGMRSTNQGLWIHSVLGWWNWWHWIHHEASRCELLIKMKAHKISKTQWGGGLWFTLNNPSHFPMHEAIKASIYLPVMSFYSSVKSMSGTWKWSELHSLTEIEWGVDERATGAGL